MRRKQRTRPDMAQLDSPVMELNLDKSCVSP